MPFPSPEVSNTQWRRGGWNGKEERSERKEERRRETQPCNLGRLNCGDSQTNGKRSG